MLNEREALEILRRADEAAKPMVPCWKLLVKGDKAFVFEDSESSGQLRATVDRQDGSITYSGLYRGHSWSSKFDEHP